MRLSSQKNPAVRLLADLFYTVPIRTSLATSSRTPNFNFLTLFVSKIAGGSKVGPKLGGQTRGLNKGKIEVLVCFFLIFNSN